MLLIQKGAAVSRLYVTKKERVLRFNCLFIFDGFSLESPTASNRKREFGFQVGVGNCFPFGSVMLCECTLTAASSWEPGFHLLKPAG